MNPLAELGFLCGEFVGIDEVSASAWSRGGSAAAEASADWGLGGNLLVQRHIERRDDGERFEALNVFMVDRGTGDVLLYSYDSAGFEPHPPARGRSGDSELVVVRRTPRGESRTTYAPTGDGYRWSKQYRLDGEAPWQDVVAGTLRRVSGS
jgi:hypothetical protein